MTFALDIKDFAKKTGQNIQDVKAIVALDMFGKVVMATPVGNPILWETPRAPAGYVGGRLRGNWQASRNTPIKTTTSRIDASGEETIKSISTTVEKATGDDSIFISNNLHGQMFSLNIEQNRIHIDQNHTSKPFMRLSYKPILIQT